jgi:hypothetical protein
MTIKIPNTPSINLNTASMHNRKEVRREELHRVSQELIADFYRTKLQDYNLNQTNLKDRNLDKDIQEINNYMNLKKNAEYKAYKYSVYLGNNLDVYV